MQKTNSSSMNRAPQRAGEIRNPSLAILLLLAAAAFLPNAAAQYQVTTLGSAIVENFSGLAMPIDAATNTVNNINFGSNSLGSTNATQRSAAWFLGNATQAAKGIGNDGLGTNNTSGGFRAWGNNATTTDRALGYLGSGSAPNRNATATFLNVTGSTVTSFVFSFTGEQWRGASGAGSISVFYSVNGSAFSALAGATYTAATGSGNLNGDAAGNFTANIGNTVSGLSLLNGQNIQFQFRLDGGSSGKGIALDDVSVAFNAAAIVAKYWTGNGTTLGGNGTWTATGGTSWSDSDTSVAGGAWDSTKIAIFKGTAGTVTVSGSVDAALGLTFSTTGYAVTGGTINLTGANIAANTITIDAAVSTAISSVLAGSNGMTKAGTGTLTLSGANTYTGGTTISAGTLALGASGVLADAGAVTVNGGTFDLNGFDETIGTLTATSAGTVALGVKSLTLAGAGSTTYSGAITATSSAGKLIKQGAGTLTLNPSGALGANATIRVEAGSVDLNRSGNAISGLLDATNVVELAGGTLILTSSSAANGAITIGGINVVSDSTIQLFRTAANSHSTSITAPLNFFNGSNLTFSYNANVTGGTTTFAGATNTLNSNGKITTGGFGVAITNAISESGGSYSLTKAGAGTLTLSGVNTYTGATNVQAGTLVLGASGTIATSSSINISSGATLDVTAKTSFTIGAAQTLSGGGSLLATGKAVTVSGTLSPGTSGVGLLSATATTFTLSGDSFFDITGTSRGTTFDAFNLTGALAYGGTLTVAFTAFTPTLGSTYDLFDFTTRSGTSVFSGITFSGHPEYAGTLDYATGTLLITAVVPEPHEYGIAFGGFLLALIVIRRRNARMTA